MVQQEEVVSLMIEVAINCTIWDSNNCVITSKNFFGLWYIYYNSAMRMKTHRDWNEYIHRLFPLLLRCVCLLLPFVILYFCIAWPKKLVDYKSTKMMMAHTEWNKSIHYLFPFLLWCVCCLLPYILWYFCKWWLLVRSG